MVCAIVPSGVPLIETLRADACQLIISPRPPDGTRLLQKRLFEDRYRVFFDRGGAGLRRGTAPNISRRRMRRWCTSRGAASISINISLRREFERKFTVMVPGFSAWPPSSAARPARDRARAACATDARRACARSAAGSLSRRADVHDLACALPGGSGAPLAARGGRVGRAFGDGRRSEGRVGVSRLGRRAAPACRDRCRRSRSRGENHERVSPSTCAQSPSAAWIAAQHARLCARDALARRRRRVDQHAQRGLEELQQRLLHQRQHAVAARGGDRAEELGDAGDRVLRAAVVRPVGVDRALDSGERRRVARARRDASAVGGSSTSASPTLRAR